MFRTVIVTVIVILISLYLLHFIVMCNIIALHCNAY